MNTAAALAIVAFFMFCFLIVVVLAMLIILVIIRNTTQARLYREAVVRARSQSSNTDLPKSGWKITYKSNGRTKFTIYDVATEPEAVKQAIQDGISDTIEKVEKV